MVKGVDPGPLFSPRDKTLRHFLALQKVAESQKLMVTSAAATNNIDVLKTSYRKYNNALWYEDFADDKAQEMTEYYNKHVKHLRPEISRTSEGSAIVKGLA